MRPAPHLQSVVIKDPDLAGIFAHATLRYLDRLGSLGQGVKLAYEDLSDGQRASNDRRCQP